MLDKEKIENVGQAGPSPDENIKMESAEWETLGDFALRTESARIIGVRRRIEKRREAEEELREIRIKSAEEKIGKESSEISERVAAAQNLSELLKNIEKNRENKYAGRVCGEEDKEEIKTEKTQIPAPDEEKETSKKADEKPKEESKQDFDMGIFVRVDETAEAAFAPVFLNSEGISFGGALKEESADAFFSGATPEVRLSGFGEWDSPAKINDSSENVCADFLADESEDFAADNTLVYGEYNENDCAQYGADTSYEPYSDEVFFASYENKEDESFASSFESEKLADEKIYPDVYQNGVLLDAGHVYEENYGFSDIGYESIDDTGADFDAPQIIPNGLTENDSYGSENFADAAEFKLAAEQSGEYKSSFEYEKYPTESDFGITNVSGESFDEYEAKALDTVDTVTAEGVWEPFEISPTYKEAHVQDENLNEINALSESDINHEFSGEYKDGGELLSFGEYEDNFGFSPLGRKELSALVKSKEKGIELLKSQMHTGEYYPGGSRFIVEDLNLQKDVLDERAALLSTCQKAGFGDMVERQKAEMLSEIAGYNELVEKYERELGHTLPLASRAIPADIIAGREYQKLSYVSFAEEEFFEVEEYRFSKSGISREEKKSLLEADREQREREKRKYSLSEKNPSEKAIERSIDEIDVRIDYSINSAIEKLDFMDNSFSVNSADNKAERRALKKKIRRLERIRKKVKEEELYNIKRYYSALAIEPESVFGAKKQASLESLRMRLDSVLNERNELNSRLIELYTDGNREDVEKINRCGAAIRRRSSKRVKRRLSREMRVLRERIPLDIKEKLVISANKLIEAESYADSLEYRMKKTKIRGNARRDMKNEIKKRRRSLKLLYADYKHFLKKARKHVERAEDFKKQLYWLLLLALIIGAALGVYFIFREQILGFLGF